MKYGQLTDNFHINEFRCNDVFKTRVPGKYVLNCLQLSQNLQVLRQHLNAPIKINSGYRTYLYNLYVKGSWGSKHKTAQAADIVAVGYSPKEVHKAIAYLIEIGKMDEGGLGSYKLFTHYDCRGTKARW